MLPGVSAPVLGLSLTCSSTRPGVFCESRWQQAIERLKCDEPTNSLRNRFNEELRRVERRIQFDVNALARAACHSVGRHVNDVASITKLAEGGFNRVLQVTFDDGYAILARLPYKSTVPKHHAVASEAATLALLRAHGVPVPKVLAYSPNNTNAVGTEYMILEKLEGTPLSEQWFSMDTKTRVKVMRQIVDLERQFMSIEFPASGSLYHRRDLDGSQHLVPVSGDIVVGPTAQHEWWYRERGSLKVDRGPCKFQECLLPLEIPNY